jgi:hypothetical protein
MRLSATLIPTVAALALAAVCAFPADAQTNPAKPSSEELVRKALQLQQQNIEGVGVTLASLTGTQMMQLAGPALARLPEDKRQQVTRELQMEVSRFEGDAAPLLKASAVKWAPSTLGAGLKTLTDDELKVLIAWLESPVSRKFQRVSDDSHRALLQKMSVETRPELDPKLKALEERMISKLKAASASAPGSLTPQKN